MTEQLLADDLDLLDDSRSRPSRVTVGLLAAIAVVLVFTGGALVQKHWGTTAGQGGGAAGGAPSFAGARAGGYGQAGGQAGGFPGGGQGFGQQQAGGQPTSPADATPVVVGTVSRLSSSHMIVKNLGGTSVTVKLPSGVTISLVKGSKLPSLAEGATVSVAGSTASDGTVTASTVTVR